MSPSSRFVPSEGRFDLSSWSAPHMKYLAHGQSARHSLLQGRSLFPFPARLSEESGDFVDPEPWNAPEAAPVRLHHDSSARRDGGADAGCCDSGPREPAKDGGLGRRIGCDQQRAGGNGAEGIQPEIRAETFPLRQNRNRSFLDP